MGFALGFSPQLRKKLHALCLFLVVGHAASFAFAQDEKEQLGRARAVFQQGIELEQAGNWSAAVQRFREVGQVRMTPQVRFHIALCEERLGKLAAALGGYELALNDADSVGPEFRAEVEVNVTQLRERIPRLVMQRGSGAEAAVISLDSVSLGDASIGAEVPVDPGPHAVSAQAPGYKPFETTISLAEGERKTLEIVLEPAPPAPTGPIGPGPGPGPPPPARYSKLPYVVGGIGVVTLVASGVLFAFRQSAAKDLEEQCPDGVCDESARDDYDRLKTYHYASIVTLGVGVAAVGAGVTWLILDRRSHKEARITVRALSPATAGATLSVRF